MTDDRGYRPSQTTSGTAHRPWPGGSQVPNAVESREAPVALSLVITTRDRADRLPTTLRTIAEIRSAYEWELVLVDNGSTDDTASVIEEFTRSAPMPVRYVFEPKPGLGRALNAGARAARGTIIATTDDDCYPSPDYVDSVMSVFENHDVAFMGGRVLPFDPSDARVSFFEREDLALLPPHSFPYPGFVGGGNLAFRRELFYAIGGFDDLMGAGTPFPCEDIEFCARASDRGWQGGYFPEPTVHHHHGRKPGRDADAVRYSYALGRGAYYAKTLLDFPTLRKGCLKWWYWSISSTPRRYTRRELFSALRYLLHRVPAAYRKMVSGRRRPEDGTPRAGVR